MKTKISTAEHRPQSVPRWLARRLRRSPRNAYLDLHERYPQWIRDAYTTVDTDGLETFCCESGSLMPDDLAEILDFADDVRATVVIGGNAQRPGCIRVVFSRQSEQGTHNADYETNGATPRRSR